MNREEMRQRCQALYEAQRAHVAEIRGDYPRTCDQEELLLRLTLKDALPEEIAGGITVDDVLHEICGELALLRNAFETEDAAYTLVDSDSRAGAWSLLERAIDRLQRIRTWQSVAGEKVRELTDPELCQRLAEVGVEPAPRKRRTRASEVSA